MAGDSGLEERIKLLEDAVEKARVQERTKWQSMLKIGGICVVLVIILLVCLGPLLPAVYTLEYVAKGGAYRDTPVKSEPGLQAQEHNSSLPAVDPQVVRPKKGKAKGKRDKQSTGVATDHKQPVEDLAPPPSDEAGAPVGGEANALAVEDGTASDENVSEGLRRQRQVCLGAPFPVVYGDKGVARALAFDAYSETKSSRGYLRNNKLDPVLAAVEKEKRKGRGLQGKDDSLPLKQFCARRRRHIPGDLDDLTQCLLRPDECTPDKQSNATAQLNGIASIKQYLPKKGSPKCITVNKACGVRPRDLTNAKESGKKIGIKAGERIVNRQPAHDLNRRMGTCAIVANGPGLYARGVGQAIDAHDVVIKMNLYHLGQRPGKFQELDKSASLFSGTKSSIRIFNAKRAEDVMKYTMMPAQNETWIYWHYRTAISLDTLIKVNPGSRFLAPQHLDSMIELYFAFRTLVIQASRITGRKKCPINLSTGVHSVLTFIHACDTVNLFGFSTRASDMTGRGRRNEVISSRMSRSHDWNLDVMILNLLAISKKINFCTQ